MAGETKPFGESLFGDRHVRRYIETAGEEGYEWRNGTKILVLFTKGRKSGEERANALIFEPDGDDYLVVASKGGAPQPPAWFLNLEAHPDAVEVQVKGDRFKARPRIAGDAEKPRMWQKMTAAWPDYDAYQQKTDRVIPIVVLERA
jgi:deazaflavin-dependent oxidoreductase (nitroreductase family)